MTRAIAVIGANYGDEGKGLVVDALCEGPDTVVLRFNGGAQAGHTVVTPEGRRHVFHHHGAGTLRGATTYLSEHFILNPLLFLREHEDLGHPRVMASPRALLTTPYDMMLNQWAEEDRGADRHGSCGLGINETVERCLDREWRSTPEDTSRSFLRSISSKYAIDRAEYLDIQLTTERRQLLMSEAVLDQYIGACAFMRDAVEWRGADELDAEAIIFEGAQGLLLDEMADGFPYLTRSRTGLANIATLCVQMGIPEIEAVFVTRTYLTRHGAGPMPTEDAALSFPDATNVRNDWQHGLRFGMLIAVELLNRVTDETASVDLVVQPTLAVTCIDQMDNEELRACAHYESRGPTRDTFRRVS